MGRQEQAYNCDSPEDLLDSGWQGLGRIMRLGCCQTDKLGAGKGEGGCHEDVAEALEAVVERAWVLPVAASYVP